ncbi:MAG: peptide chain release factor N(5)-glutamine methyltransferase [Enterobacter sp.]|nr:peptide chain release factor N(5)-glutamine methyltransferase [Enterobacter sp.]
MAFAGFQHQLIRRKAEHRERGGNHVEQALARLPVSSCRILDLGTGTGAIALALATERPDCAITAVDVMPDAVALAQRNVERLGLTNVTVLQSSWFSALEKQTFGVIVSNPPYIDERDPHLAQGDVRFEPLTALVAAREGLADLEHIVTTSRQHLLSGGWLLVEHGWTQGEAVRAIFRAAGYGNIATCRDYGDNERLTLGQYQGGV